LGYNRESNKNAHDLEALQAAKNKPVFDDGTWGFFRYTQPRASAQRSRLFEQLMHIVHDSKLCRAFKE
jgi:hypothetical protein